MLYQLLFALFFLSFPNENERERQGEREKAKEKKENREKDEDKGLPLSNSRFLFFLVNAWMGEDSGLKVPFSNTVVLFLLVVILYLFK